MEQRGGDERWNPGDRVSERPGGKGCRGHEGGGERGEKERN